MAYSPAWTHYVDSESSVASPKPNSRAARASASGATSASSQGAVTRRSTPSSASRKSSESRSRRSSQEWRVIMTGAELRPGEDAKGAWRKAFEALGFGVGRTPDESV
jgi:hypothetical protein